MQLESRVSAKTRIEVVTEGILTRMLQSDPELSGVSMIIFDEFHERSLAADLGLALTLQSQECYREEPLKLLIMSATLQADQLGKTLGAPVIVSEASVTRSLFTTVTNPLLTAAFIQSALKSAAPS